ncbi:MAG: aldehyde dehydrogenase family protein [Candidatus Aminicenantes bacterium]|nr:aldehyde dehydrogenase family protein [Candidatus Aminicenantes bacterium]
MIQNRLFIQNEWKKSAKSIESINPATLKPIGRAGLGSQQDCRQAIQVAKQAYPSWKEMPFPSKKAIFRKAKQILLDRSLEISQLITYEKGSPLPESMTMEVNSSLESIDYYIHNMEALLKPKKMKHHMVLFNHKKGCFQYYSLGPMLVISPWNFPFVIPFLDVISGLTAGNTVVLRPSSTTPFCGLIIGEVFKEAGLPQGVLNIVPCSVKQAEEMITHSDIQLISFTGSTFTGKRIMELASQNLTNIHLELGGKDPMIVLKDADIQRAATGAVWGAFANCGQSCGSVERVYVEKSIAPEFTEKVVELTKKLKVGDPKFEGVDVGPMTSHRQMEKVEEHIKDAQEKGAEVLVGGERISDFQGYFIRPSVLSRVDHSMKIMKKETFGPVLPIMTFSDLNEAASLANDSDFGLTASVWTRNRKKALKMAEMISSGTVTINDHMSSYTEPGAIWGGIKHTGIGRSHGPIGFKELVYAKFISRDFSKNKNLIWWFPYEKDFFKVIKKSLSLFYSAQRGKRIKTLVSMIPFLSMIKKRSPVFNFIKGIPRILKK